MAKQLAFDHCITQVGAVDFYEGIFTSMALKVYHAGGDFFADAGLSQEQHSGIRFSCFFDEMAEFLDGKTIAD
jgi:hypothetical protein